MGEGIYIGLGSNVGDSCRNCAAGIDEIIRDERAVLSGLSSLYLTSPVSDVPQPDFFNCVLQIVWGGSPFDLLALLRKTEEGMGRRREIPGGPRTIDLDILFFGDLVLDAPDLIIPHPRLHERKFAIVPCLEIDPAVVHPRFGRPLSEFLPAAGEDQKITLFKRVLRDEIRTPGHFWDTAR